MITKALADWRARRRPLIEAQKAIFRNQDAEEALGLTHESDEYLRLHDEYYALAAKQPWWVRLGVWGRALREHQAETNVES